MLSSFAIKELSAINTLLFLPYAFDPRAAAKSNKGVEVLCCIALKSFITVMVRVLRGPAAANRCVRKIRRIIHCCVCEDRAFYPETVYPIGEFPVWGLFFYF